jgi:hypothetical protein
MRGCVGAVNFQRITDNLVSESQSTDLLSRPMNDEPLFGIILCLADRVVLYSYSTDRTAELFPKMSHNLPPIARFCGARSARPLIFAFGGWRLTARFHRATIGTKETHVSVPRGSTNSLPVGPPLGSVPISAAR